MRFAQVVRGKRAEKPIKVPVPGAGDVDAVVVALSGMEVVDAVAAATKFAKGKGIDNPGAGNPVYENALWAETLLASVLDVDSPKEKRARFFDSAEQILDELDPDSMAMLYEEQSLWQEEISPIERARTLPDLLAITKGLAAEGDIAERFFVGLSPRTRLIWSRTTARLLVSSPELKSLYSSASEPSSPTSPKS